MTKKEFKLFLFWIALLVLSAPFAAADDANIIKIGVVLPLSGRAAEYGEYNREGLELARQELSSNAQIDLIYEDDMCEPKHGISATRKLIQVDKVDAIFGSWCSSVVLSQAPIVEQERTLLMASAISPQIRNAGEYVFRIQPDASVYLQKMLDQVLTKESYPTWAILSIENDFGVDQAEFLKKEVESKGRSVIFSEPYLPDTKDFRTQLFKIKEKNPSAVFLPGYNEVGLILRQAKEIGLKSQFFGSLPFENETVLKVAGAGAEDVVFPSHFEPESRLPSVREFQRKYREKFGRPAEGFAMLAYEALHALVKSLMSCKRDVSCTMEVLKKRRFFGVQGTYSFDSYGDGVREIITKKVQNGRAVPVG